MRGRPERCLACPPAAPGHQGAPWPGTRRGTRCFRHSRSPRPRLRSAAGSAPIPCAIAELAPYRRDRAATESPRSRHRAPRPVAAGAVLAPAKRAPGSVNGAARPTTVSPKVPAPSTATCHRSAPRHGSPRAPRRRRARPSPRLRRSIPRGRRAVGFRGPRGPRSTSPRRCPCSTRSVDPGRRSRRPRAEQPPVLPSAQAGQGGWMPRGTHPMTDSTTTPSAGSERPVDVLASVAVGHESSGQGCRGRTPSPPPRSRGRVRTGSSRVARSTGSCARRAWPGRTRRSPRVLGRTRYQPGPGITGASRSVKRSGPTFTPLPDPTRLEATREAAKRTGLRSKTSPFIYVT